MRQARVPGRQQKAERVSSGKVQDLAAAWVRACTHAIGQCVRSRALSVVLTLLLSFPAAAVQPDEMLEDPVLEARAREISQELRCLVCRNESIDDSNADLARDLRLLVRERLVAGDTDAEVRQFLVDRYGEFVLLKPPFSAANAALYLFPAIAFFGGLGIVLVYLRRRAGSGHRREVPDTPLSDDEKRRLDSILGG